jgi:tRNA A37 threonylcarbamoyladenosine modification protein TsaB
MDAARGEVFAARYRRDLASPTRLAPVDDPVSARPETVRSRWDTDGRAVTRWIGDGATRYRAHLPEHADVRPSPLLAPLVGRLAVARRGEAGAPHALRPLYVRPPDAELARRR